MLKTKFRYLLFIFPLLIFLCACTTTKQIRLAEEIVNPNFENLETVQFHGPLWESFSEVEEAYPSGVEHIALQSDSDLKEILKKKEMMYLNYEVINCDNRKEVLLFGPIFIDPNTYGENETYVFHIGLPKDIDLAITEHMSVFSPFHKGYEEPLKGLCLSLGAGSMIGSTLETNGIQIR